jgi:hypothetical protein
MSQGKTLMEVFAAEEARSHGGKRKGAGRKPTGPNTILASFSLSKEIVRSLSTAVRRGQRSKFVEAAISEKLNYLK